jgi:hypothetical protein
MNDSFLGLALINRYYIPWVIPNKQMVHFLGRRVERNMRFWLELLNWRISISEIEGKL